MCNVEEIADCGDILTLGRALFITEKEDKTWLSKCSVSLSSCGNLLAVGYKKRLCFLTAQWISSIDSNTYLVSWSGTLPSEITSILTLSICPSQQSSQNGPDWFCIVVGFQNGSIGFYTNTGHVLLHEKLDEKPVLKISCHTGTYGTLPDDVHILFQTGVCVLTGSSLFQTLRNAKAQVAKVHAGIRDDNAVDIRNIQIRKWSFSEQEQINDAAVVGLELKNTYDHFLAASTYGGYDTWYRSIPPVNTLVLTTGISPYMGFQYALEGGTTPPLQDVARAVANKIKSALPGWLGGSTETAPTNTEPLIRAEQLSMRNGIFDAQRHGTTVAISPDRRLAAFTDSLGRVAVLDISKGYVIKLFKGCRDAQCAFVQIFDADTKKPQLSLVKEIRRALFLIIYNPKKGLIDIRLMQRGSRVAVFTATKNGKLLYNTCGLTGAEKNYTHKKLNLPEFQCVLIDPDGKLKRFNIPFYYSLEGEHLERSKDLHIIRAIRDSIKKNPYLSDEIKDEIIQSAAKLKTLEIKKHCLEMLIKNCETSSETLISCLEIFWDSITNEKLNSIVKKIKDFFGNLALVTLFHRHICNETTDDMKNLIAKVCETFELEKPLKTSDEKNDEDDLDFHLLEDDNCILERLLILAQEKDFREQQHTKVTFADNRISTYKDFISCFVLDNRGEFITLKPDITTEKLNNLSCDIFKSILKLNDLTLLTDFVKDSNIDPQEIVKLVIMHVSNMPLEEINLDLIEKIIAVLYYLCRSSEEATDIIYNEISPWWENIREKLVGLPCPLRSMIIAMACKSVANIFETKSSDNEDAWESLTKETAKWGILIGKLEDISILSIILMCKANFNGKTLPKLPFEEMNINLKYIYTRGKGSVTELIAKWLCGMGVPPEAIVANELMEIFDATSDSEMNTSTSEDKTEFVLMENNRHHIDNNPQVFKWLSLLRRQFPLSTKADYVIANMCWEYAMEWQKSLNKTMELEAVLHCLQNILDLHLRLGLFSIIWLTYIKYTFEDSCRLVNKVGKLPKDHLCVQDLGFNSECLKSFLKTTKNYLDRFYACSLKTFDHTKQEIQFEKIWDESLPSLVEVAQDTKNLNIDILNLNYQIACTIYYQCHFNLKFTKPLDSLYDIDYQYILEALAGNVVQRDISMKCSEKLMGPRMKYLTKLTRTAIETISCVDNNVESKSYNNEECLHWIENICVLAELWGIDINFVRRQYVVGLYHRGYDELAENILGLITEPQVLLEPILAITIQRLKRYLENSTKSNQHSMIVTMPPQLYKKMQNMILDPSIPSHPSLSTTVLVLQKLLSQIVKKTPDAEEMQDIKLAKLIIESCEIFIQWKRDA
ncbi:LOW QUALITY PROTEIN: rab3 GTPase-activating protein non-catalytic subunit [Maniola hyperantus]|uniref:LOW QUALITY PROTEIN: rab3 GTPase-activating protein non-catalytic subunit n=1 Tax=Aphantopus hyperantus TaxID=2795564 RepID=UPI001568D771|nr:LOW QUALITY PROTEIN: rab3 GTPase-activating protein regulatory subunit [Maniola hyperantus]